VLSRAAAAPNQTSSGSGARTAPEAICGYRAQSWLDGKLIMSLITEGEKADEILSNTAVTAT
jgi:hypothetical protein